MNKYNCNTFSNFLSINKQFDLPVNLYVDNFNEPIPNGINIAYICEPQSVSNNKDFFIKNQEKYDVILTFNKDVLNSCKNSEFFEFGTCWVSKNNVNINNKTFSVSFLVGNKVISGCDGHILRHQVYDNQSRIKLDKKFFNSSRMPYKPQELKNFIYDDKSPLFDSQFHICIENSQETNYFSEKLIDCLYSKTIPIYWGCPNIGDWFNTDSIFIVNNLEELISKVNSISEKTYEKLTYSIEENYKKSLEFLDLHERLYKKIDDIVDRHKK
jgi:hypothetical protein